jgi:ORF6N domain-containing protein
MNETVVRVPVELIEKAIFLIRGEKVMLDRDLAALYGVETRVLNQSVRRNLERFPSDFMFELTRDEILGISQFVTSSDLKFSKRVTVFTEQGVAMLSSVLRSKRAIAVNVEIMRAFVRLRQMLSSNAELAKQLKELERKYDRQFKVVFDAIRQLMTPPEPKRKQIGFHAKAAKG